jgi:hypothetical protein
MAVGTGRGTALGLRIGEELFGRVTLSEHRDGVSRGAQYRRLIGRLPPLPLPLHPFRPTPDRRRQWAGATDGERRRGVFAYWSG